MKKRFLPLMLALAMLVGVLAACAAPPAPAPSEKPQIQEPATPAPTAEQPPSPEAPKGIGPNMLLLPSTENMGDKFPGAWDNYGFIGKFLIYSRLLRLDSNLMPVYGDLAEKWEVLEDGMKYVFTLRTDVKWHDGEAFTGDDVAYSIKQALKATQVNGVIKGAFRCIKGAEEFLANEKAIPADDVEGIKVDGNTLTITMAKPSGTFLLSIAQFNIFPRHKIEGLDPLTMNASTFYDWPIGTGPYKIVEFVPNDYALFEVFDDYYGPKPEIKQVKMTQMTQADYPARALANEIDFFYTNDLNTALAAIENPNYQAFYTDIYFIRYFMWNSFGPGGKGDDPFKDIKARRAFVHAIDRQALIDNLMPNQATLLNGKVPQAFDYCNKDVYDLKYDPALAKQLFEEAGFDFSKTIKLAAYYADQGTADFMDAICAYLGEVGVKAEWHLLTGDITAQLYDVRDFNVVYAGLSAMAVEEAYNLYHSGNLKGMIQAKVFPAGYKGLDELLEELWVTIDPARRKEILIQIQKIESEEMLWTMPMFALRNVQVFNTARVNLPPELTLSNEWSNYERYIEKWTINSAE